MDKIEELLKRRIQIFEGTPSIFPSLEEAKKKLNENSGLRIYLGIDPTGPDLHIGHTIPLLFLKQLLEIGQKPVLLIGDFTARIGDPTGKDVTRKPLTEAEVKNNMKNYLIQVYKILPEGSFDVVYNNDWLSKISMQEFFNLASHVSVEQLQTRNMFRERKKKGNFLGVHEFLYPLMQGYDSVAMAIDGEVGGSDQMFNMLIGRDLEKKLINKDKLVFGTRLLVTESGKKMSKTEGGLISLSDSADEIFGKTMKTVPDEMIVTVFELCTEKDWAWINDNREAIKSDPYKYKKELALELTTMYHGVKPSEEAADEFEKVFTRKEKPSEIEEIKVKSKNIVDALVETKLASSKSEAKRLIEQKGVKVNDEATTEESSIKSGDLIQVGKRKFIRIK